MFDAGAVLEEHDLDVPDGIDVKVVENTDDGVHITIPARPNADLSDDLLESATGGEQSSLDGIEIVHPIDGLPLMPQQF